MAAGSGEAIDTGTEAAAAGGGDDDRELEDELDEEDVDAEVIVTRRGCEGDCERGCGVDGCCCRKIS